MAMNQNPFAVGAPAKSNNSTAFRASTTAPTRQQQQPQQLSPAQFTPTLTPQQQQQGAQLLEQQFAPALQQRQQQGAQLLEQQFAAALPQQQLQQPTVQQQQQIQQLAPTLQQIGYAPSSSRGAINRRSPGILGRQMGYRKF